MWWGVGVVVGVGGVCGGALRNLSVAILDVMC